MTLLNADEYTSFMVVAATIYLLFTEFNGTINDFKIEKWIDVAITAEWNIKISIFLLNSADGYKI